MKKPRIGLIPSCIDCDPARPKPSKGCIEGVQRAGGEVVIIDYAASDADLRAVFEALDGLLLQGGGDINPARYGEPMHQKCGPVFYERDKLELRAIGLALERDMPLMAICRGTQVVNVALGGTLVQDLPEELGLNHNLGEQPSEAHRVQLLDGSLVKQAVALDTLVTNSIHHQSVNRPGDGLIVSACTDDGVIEAVERPASRFLLGLQWHPECTLDVDDASVRFFQALVDAC